ncbi:MAG: hypothetical protein RR744_00260 [Cellulosilyticaceae bacterium]
MRREEIKKSIANKIGQMLGIYKKTTNNKKGEITMTSKNIRKILLESGVEIKGSYDRVKVWLPEVEEFSGIKDFTLSDKVNVTIDLSTFHEGKVLDVGSLFFETDIEVAVGVSKTEVYTNKGRVMTIRELFELPHKSGKRPERDSYVRIKNCFSGDTVVALGGIILKSSLVSNIGTVKSVSDRDGVVSIAIGDKTLRLPAYCCEDVSGLIFSEKFKNINKFLKDSGYHPTIDGTMLGIMQTDDGDYIEYITDKRMERLEGKDIYDKEIRAKYATKKKIRGAIQLLYPNISSNTMEDVIMLYCAKSADVEILTGEAMKEVFKSDRCSGGGSIASSCMRDKDTSYFDIYVDNCDGIAVIRGGDNKIILRAILWTIKHPNGKVKKFMDRIYSGNTAYETKMKAWAIQNDYAYLKSQSHSETRMMLPDGKQEHFKDWFIECNKFEYRKYPYLDTFSTFAGGRLFYRNQPVFELKSTGGGNSCLCGER